MFTQVHDDIQICINLHNNQSNSNVIASVNFTMIEFTSQKDKEGNNTTVDYEATTTFFSLMIGTKEIGFKQQTNQTKPLALLFEISKHKSRRWSVEFWMNGTA